MDSDAYYLALGVPKNASLTTITRAYRLLARTCHPDKNPEDPQGAEAKFKLIVEAYDALKDPVLRDIYDRLGKAGLQPDEPAELEHTAEGDMGGDDAWMDDYEWDELPPGTSVPRGSVVKLGINTKVTYIGVLIPVETYQDHGHIWEFRRRRAGDQWRWEGGEWTNYPVDASDPGPSPGTPRMRPGSCEGVARKLRGSLRAYERLCVILVWLC